MNKLYPGISQTAAARMERIAGSYASMSNIEQLAFTQSLREARKRGAKAKAVTERSSNAEQADRDEAATGSADSESGEHPESEDAGG